MHLTGTQTVFGEGVARAEIMFVGEALEEAGIDRRLAYVTNPVKHFKWTARGKRRIHRKPNAAEVAACRPWLEAEPEGLGATAAQALIGRQFRVSKDRGVPVESDLAPVVMATVHPSSILRSDDRERELELFVEDLRRAAAALRAA